jgi:hypothetical protein
MVFLMYYLLLFVFMLFATDFPGACLEAGRKDRAIPVTGRGGL